LQNCDKCKGKRWYVVLDKKTGKQKKRNGKRLWRCYRCNHKQVEPDAPNILDKRIRAKPNILYIDLEISKSIYYSYGARVPSKYLNVEDLVQEYYMICWAASYLGDNNVFHARVSSGSAKKGRDKVILKQLRELMASADIIAGHNVDAYDMKRANTRFILNGIEPVINVKTLDTLKIARQKFTFESKKLDYISQRLGFGSKDKITNEDWNNIMRGDENTLEKVDKYCVGDVKNGKKVLAVLMNYSGKKVGYGGVSLKETDKPLLWEAE